jgi:hypothetical protein
LLKPRSTDANNYLSCANYPCNNLLTLIKKYLFFFGINFECFNRAGVYEEEDFQPGLYGYGVCAEVPEARAAAAVREVEEELQRVVKSSRSRQGEAWEPLMQKQVRQEELVVIWSLVYNAGTVCLKAW